MGCIKSKLKKDERSDIYRVVQDTAQELRNNTYSEIDPTYNQKTPSPNQIIKAKRLRGSSQSLTSMTVGSRIGTSMWNFGRKIKEQDVEIMTVDPLYVIVPYFNYCGFKRRRELFLQFYHHIKDNPRIRIVLCEASETNGMFELPLDLPNVFLHIHVYTKDQLWIKENLVNLAVRRLPAHWKYIAWVDCDIHFINEDWVENLLERFSKYDVVQLFSSVVYLGPHNETIKTDRGFGYMYRRSGKSYTQTYRYGFWHPGFAWACTKNAYYAMEGLIDYAILGSGDHHMALGLISKMECSHPKNIHPNYRRLLRDFEKRTRHLKLGYIDGTILHYWHGDLKLRRYKERWQILTDHQYDPLIDVYHDPIGLYQLTDSGKKLDRDLRDYFAGRLEDDTRVLS